MVNQICFDIWGILKMATVKSSEPPNNSFSIHHIIRCRPGGLGIFTDRDPVAYFWGFELRKVVFF